MPTIIDYPTVLKTLESAGLRCVYPNSGAFGLTPGDSSHVVGWITAEDSTIRPVMRAVARIIQPPDSASLASLIMRVWQQYFPGPLWLMPASHWSYELQFGGADWLPALLERNGIDGEMLRSRSDGSAIRFELADIDSVSAIVEVLLQRMIASDFTIAFPGRPVVATLHHHQQVWWQTNERGIFEAIDSLR